MLVAMDTATRFASLALHDGVKLRFEMTWEAGRRHTVQLTPRLVTALGDLGLGPEALSGVAVTVGPGSYTGLRVALAVAKGLVLARGLDLVGIPTLDVLAAAQDQDARPLVAVLQAGRGRICVATYRWHEGWQQQEAPRLTTWDELVPQIERPVLFCGEVEKRGTAALKPLRKRAVILPPTRRLRRAGFLAELAWDRIRHGQIDAPESLVPVYLH
ncbi:MAG: tRNA (adenosine(37)-N6)-threonylcarbamoyltransferase complex dimerization subunit type 1 TsaB [Anaerolineae bacterium]|jgi:tRNA threonylcarbamoyladenosine biosynthesis protein TsaB